MLLITTLTPRQARADDTHAAPCYAHMIRCRRYARLRYAAMLHFDTPPADFQDAFVFERRRYDTTCWR